MLRSFGSGVTVFYISIFNDVFDDCVGRLEEKYIEMDKEKLEGIQYRFYNWFRHMLRSMEQYICINRSADFYE